MLAIQRAAAVVMICLPTAGEALSSLDLVATMTGLIVFTLGMEVWGASRQGSGMFARDKPCGYVGSCGKRELQAMLGDGGQVDVDALGEQSRYKGSGVASAPM